MSRAWTISPVSTSPDDHPRCTSHAPRAIAAGRLATRRYPPENDGCDDREVGIVVVVHVGVAHSGNLIARDRELVGRDFGVVMRKRLADLRWSRATRVVDVTGVRIAIGDVLVD